MTSHNGASWLVQIICRCYCSEITKVSTGYVCGWDIEENKCVQQFGTEILYHDSSKLEPVVTLYVPLRSYLKVKSSV